MTDDINTNLATLIAQNIAVTQRLDKFIETQAITNQQLATGLVDARGANGRTWAYLSAVVVGAFVAMYAFVMLGVSNQVGPLAQGIALQAISVASLQTQVAELGQKNIEFGTQVNCLEIMREYENSVQEMMRGLEATGEIKIGPGQTLPTLAYHPFCQPTASPAR